jgi:hypothetical protein
MNDQIKRTITGMDKLIAALCLEAFKRMNPTGKRNRAGHFNPYSIPSDAQDLVDMKRGVYDETISEEQAKAAMLKIRLNNNWL